jgi:LmbE family N-acetylglucosaminyl deacetylase
MIETLSETEFAPSTTEDSFIPNVFVDISEYMDKKLEIMRVFESEIAQHPFPRNERNIKALGTLRGATCGVEYAESFMLLKEIR